MKKPEPAKTPLPLVRYSKAAERLDVCERTVWNLVKAGKLQKVIIGPGCVRITGESLEALATGQVAAMAV